MRITMRMRNRRKNVCNVVSADLAFGARPGQVACNGSAAVPMEGAGVSPANWRLSVASPHHRHFSRSTALLPARKAARRRVVPCSRARRPRSIVQALSWSFQEFLARRDKRFLWAWDFPSLLPIGRSAFPGRGACCVADRESDLARTGRMAVADREIGAPRAFRSFFPGPYLNPDGRPIIGHCYTMGTTDAFTYEPVRSLPVRRPGTPLPVPAQANDDQQERAVSPSDADFRFGNMGAFLPADSK